MIAVTLTWEGLAALALLVILVIVLALAWIGRDKKFTRARVGFFIERDHPSTDPFSEVPKEFEQWLVDYVERMPPLLPEPEET